MDDLDTMLVRLAEGPMPANLDGLEARVLARIAAQPRAGVGVGLGSMTIAVALVMGIAGAELPVRHTSAAAPLSQFGSVPALAPSTLLVGEP